MPVLRTISFRGLVPGSVASDYDAIVWLQGDPEPTTGRIVAQVSACARPEPLAVNISVAPGNYFFKLRHIPSGISGAPTPFTIAQPVQVPMSIGAVVITVVNGAYRAVVNWVSGIGPHTVSLRTSSGTVLATATSPNGSTQATINLPVGIVAQVGVTARVVDSTNVTVQRSDVSLPVRPDCDLVWRDSQEASAASLDTRWNLTTRELFLETRSLRSGISPFSVRMYQGAIIRHQFSYTSLQGPWHVLPGTVENGTYEVEVQDATGCITPRRSVLLGAYLAPVASDTETLTPPLGLLKVAITYSASSHEASVHLNGQNILLRVSATVAPQPSGLTWVSAANDTPWNNSTFIPGTTQFPLAGYGRVYRLNPQTLGVGGMTNNKEYNLDFKIAGTNTFYRVRYTTPAVSVTTPAVLYEQSVAPPVDTVTLTPPPALLKAAITYSAATHEASVHMNGTNISLRVSAASAPQPSGLTWVNTNGDTVWNDTTYIPGTTQFSLTGYDRVFRLNPQTLGVGGLINNKLYNFDFKAAGTNTFYRIQYTTPAVNVITPAVLYEQQGQPAFCDLIWNTDTPGVATRWQGGTRQLFVSLYSNRANLSPFTTRIFQNNVIVHTFTWPNPQGQWHNLPNTLLNGSYDVEVEDNTGCRTTRRFVSFAAPDAGSGNSETAVDSSIPSGLRSVDVGTKRYLFRDADGLILTANSVGVVDPNQHTMVKNGVTFNAWYKIESTSATPDVVTMLQGAGYPLRLNESYSIEKRWFANSYTSQNQIDNVIWQASRNNVVGSARTVVSMHNI